RPAPAADRPVLVAFGDARRTAAPGPLPAALEAAVASWLGAQHRPLHKIDPARLEPRLAAKAAAAAGSELAIGFWIVGWTVEPAPDAAAVAMARARVRVQIATPSAVVFDRVVATDTVLGDRGLGEAELAARVAREVLAILRPHVRRSVPSWQ
ncbi:MAG TPA: hypothetical protein VFT22_38585, partial [Kofleriaceae bacterium]|nr:hypothetical protein [Kofleriaceae bacterium]